jgi:hypothetical protein
MKEKRYKKVQKCIEEIDLCDLQCVFYDIKVGTTFHKTQHNIGVSKSNIPIWTSFFSAITTCKYLVRS